MIINDRYGTVTNRPVYLASREYIRENGYLLAAILIVLFVECPVWRYPKHTRRIQWFFWGYYLPLLIILVVLPALALCRGTYYCFLPERAYRMVLRSHRIVAHSLLQRSMKRM